MTIQLSAAMEAARTLTEKRPHYAVTFEGVPYVFGDAAIGFTTPLLFGGALFGEIDPATGQTYTFGAVVENASSLSRTLKTPSGFGSDVNPEQGSSSISSVTIPLLVSAALLDMMANYTIKGKLVQISCGLNDVDATDWLVIWTGIVDDIKQWGDALGYNIEASDPQRLEKRSCFNVLTAKTGADFTAISTASILVDSTTTWPSSGYAKIDKEIVQYVGIDATHLGTTSLTRARLGTIAAAHSQNTVIGELLLLGHTNQAGYTGHPVDIALMVMTSTGAGTNGPWDVLAARHGMKIPISMFDLPTWTDARDELTGVAYEFWVDRSENEGKQWIEREIFKPNALYQVTRGDGKLRLKLFEPPTAEDTLQEITDANTVGIPAIDGNFHRHYNEIAWAYDWQPTENAFAPPRIEESPESKAKYGKTYSFAIESRGLRTKFSDGTVGSAAAIATARSSQLFARYGDPPMTVGLTGLFSTFHIEPGDLIIWTSDLSLDHRKGLRGAGPYVLEVVAKSPDFAQGVMGFQCLYTPFAGARFAKWAAVGTGDYTTVPQGTKDLFVFIGLDGEMSNADPAYRYQ